MNGEIEGGIAFSSRGRETVSAAADVSLSRDSNTSMHSDRTPGITVPTASASHLPSKALATEEARRALGVVHFLRRYAIFLVLAALILFFSVT